MLLRPMLLLLSCLLSATVLAQSGPRLAPGKTARDYNDAGRALGKALKALGHAVDLGEDLLPLLALDEGTTVRTWTERRVEGPVDIRDLEVGAAQGKGNAAAVAFWSGRRARFELLDHALFKPVRVDVLEADGSLEGVFRYELTGTDAEGQRCVERATLRGRWTPHGEHGYALASFGLARGQVVRGPGDLFVDRAKEWGLDCYGEVDPRFLPPSKELRYQLLRHAVGGASAGDIDGDGWDDVLLTTGRRLKLFRNERGRFRDVTAEAGLAEVEYATAAVFADFDDDGDVDLYLGRFYGQNLLFENRGDGRFVDRTAGSGLAGDDMTAVLAVADLDGDQRLDLYVGRFLDARSEVPDTILYTRNGAPNRVYRGRGDLTFEDVSERSGADDEGLTLGVGIADYDVDGDQDIYLSNDFGRNVLYRNRGDGTFEDATLETGTLAVSGGMSVAWGDVDGDERLDIYVSSISSNQRWFSQDVNIRAYVLNIVRSQRRERLQPLFLDLRKHMGDAWPQVGEQSLSGNYLLRQADGGKFEDWSDRSGARPQGWYWSSGFFDVDNDGHQDVFAVAGWLTGELKDDL